MRTTDTAAGGAAGKLHCATTVRSCGIRRPSEKPARGFLDVVVVRNDQARRGVHGPGVQEELDTGMDRQRIAAMRRLHPDRSAPEPMAWARPAGARGGRRGHIARNATRRPPPARRRRHERQRAIDERVQSG